jgi:hypothetical protein
MKGKKNLLRYTCDFANMNKGGLNGVYDPFYLSLRVKNLLLHNCMLDSGESTNVIPLIVMHQLGLKITRPYRNICAMDRREVEVFG